MGTHFSIHEAALTNYSGMWLKRKSGLDFTAQLAPSPLGPKVSRLAPFVTPWRTIRIADDAAGLYENDLELNLNEPNKIGDVSWFKPHKYIGIWWAMHVDKWTWGSGVRRGATTEHAKYYIDFAAKYGFRGVLIEGWNEGWDGGWFGSGRDFSFTQSNPEFDVKVVAGYAREKGVYIIGHHETGGNINVYEDQLVAAMAFYNKLGIDAVKTGYVADAGGVIGTDPEGQEMLFWHDGQRMTQHHQLVVETAAENQIAVNPHEPIKDTGLRRTYPNLVSREGARGMEYQAWGNPKNFPAHVPTLVFTRMLAGPMDYTPGVFSLRGRDNTVIQSTLARQLALYVVLYSPIQMAADLPENLEEYPKQLKFVADVPADWSESVILNASVGEHVVMARKDRNSDSWYLGGVTDAEKRNVSLPLDFLDDSKKYQAQIYRDGPLADGLGENRHDMVIEQKTVTKDTILSIEMARAGGFAVSIVLIQ
jgi:alpha-glucosidase